MSFPPRTADLLVGGGFGVADDLGNKLVHGRHGHLRKHGHGATERGDQKRERERERDKKMRRKRRRRKKRKAMRREPEKACGQKNPKLKKCKQTNKTRGREIQETQRESTQGASHLQWAAVWGRPTQATKSSSRRGRRRTRRA